MLQGEDFIVKATVRDSTDTLVDLTEGTMLSIQSKAFCP
jgi:hypothetical protein